MTYRAVIIPIKAFITRRKHVIKVAFVLSELGTWKTEILYNRMKAHPRFDPYLVVVSSLENSNARKILLSYLENHHYRYIVLADDKKISTVVRADIIFYQKPYPNVIPAKHRVKYNRSSLFCFVTYGISTIRESWAVNQPVQLYAWMNFQFNDSASRELSIISVIRGRNFVVTGFPMTDAFTSYELGKNDPWKKCVGPKRKRIIWAPHHTIPQEGNWLDYSTFLDYCQVMIEIAKKYTNEVQFAFKPHPSLRGKLERLWGSEETRLYYDEWASMQSAQIVEGEYVDLFMNSDALIHDCSSFIIEYMYTGKPVLFLDNNHDHTSNMLEYAKAAYNLQYFASNADSIDEFVRSVITDYDPMKESRDSFVETNLIPRGLSASDNIINSILGSQQQCSQ